MTVQLPLPRYVIAKPLALGKIAYYFNISSELRELKCPVPNEPLGTDYVLACGHDGKGGRAAVLNGRIDEWEAQRKGLPISAPAGPRIGTVDWLFKQYKRTAAYLEKVSKRSRPDYERASRCSHGAASNSVPKKPRLLPQQR